MNHPLSPAVRTYLEGIAAEHVRCGDRVEGLVRSLHLTVELQITDGMPPLVVDERRDPDLSSGRGIAKLPTKCADDISDEELTATLQAVLGTPRHRR